MFLFPESYTALFTFHYEDELLYLSFNDNEEKNLYIDLNLQLPSYLWSALQNNFYSSEDLMNCRFFIQRDGEYIPKSKIVFGMLLVNLKGVKTLKLMIISNFHYLIDLMLFIQNKPYLNKNILFIM